MTNIIPKMQLPYKNCQHLKNKRRIRSASELAIKKNTLKYTIKEVLHIIQQHFWVSHIVSSKKMYGYLA